MISQKSCALYHQQYGDSGLRLCCYDWHKIPMFEFADDGLSKEAISGENSASTAQTDVSILTIFLITTHFLHYIVLT